MSASAIIHKCRSGANTLRRGYIHPTGPPSGKAGRREGGEGREHTSATFRRRRPGAWRYSSGPPTTPSTGPAAAAAEKALESSLTNKKSAPGYSPLTSARPEALLWEAPALRPTGASEIRNPRSDQFKYKRRPTSVSAGEHYQNPFPPRPVTQGPRGTERGSPWEAGI